MKRVIFAVLMLAAGVPRLFAAASPAAGPAQKSAPTNPACMELKALNAKERSEVTELDARIKAVRGQFDGQIKPLEEQRKSLGEQYRSRRDALMDQIQPGYGDAMKAFDEQQKDLSEKEKEEVRVVREKYEQMRRSNKPPKANLNCR